MSKSVTGSPFNFLNSEQKRKFKGEILKSIKFDSTKDSALIESIRKDMSNLISDEDEDENL